MYLKTLQIKNFKSFQDITIEFNAGVNILTGVNNAGKTTMLEAVSLWHECFLKLIQKAKRGTKNYKKGDYILGNTSNKYFFYDQINSVRAPNFEDIFYQCDKKNTIELRAVFEKKQDDEIKTLDVNFKIAVSGLNYSIELIENTQYDYRKFNRFFSNLPHVISLYYASPISIIRQTELFSTAPQVEQATLHRNSVEVLRNRFAHLYKQARFSYFLEDLSTILFNGKKKITFSITSDIQKNTNIEVFFSIGTQDTEKEIALLGSGTLQVIEILLNLYSYDNASKDMGLVLLDEPDSHIHRDIQQRLLLILIRFSQNTQILLTTHNESLIRNAPIHYLFHLENKPNNHYRNLGTKEIGALEPRFSGIYPAITNPVISELGNCNGLDFVNAIESDCLIFVEGEDDARVIDILLKKGLINNHKRYVYWVLGGVSKIFKEIISYKTVFSTIKNEQTLWKKSVLIFDRDYLTDKQREHLIEKFSDTNGKISIKTHLWNAYTFESTLLTDLNKTARLLNRWLSSLNINIDELNLLASLQMAYQASKNSLVNEFSDDFYEQLAHRYEGNQKQERNIFGNQIITTGNPQQLNSQGRNHIQECLDSEDFYKLMKKEDVEAVINKAIESYDIEFNIENDFITLIQKVDKSTWLDEWDFLLRI